MGACTSARDRLTRSFEQTQETRLRELGGIRPGGGCAIARPQCIRVQMATPPAQDCVRSEAKSARARQVVEDAGWDERERRQTRMAVTNLLTYKKCRRGQNPAVKQMRASS